MVKKPFVLIICDGWGYRPESFGNAIAEATTPELDKLNETWPHTLIEAAGEAVGLPEGQMGNSEVGHLTIGGGRIIRQPLVRQKHEIQTGVFYQNEVLIEAIELAKQRGKALHIAGLVSPGGVHSHPDGALAIAKLAKELGQTNVHIHVFADGRDTPPTSGLKHITEFEQELAKIGNGRIASIAGRYYAMDRDNRWERIELAYEMLVGTSHATIPTAAAYIQQRYAKGETDEFLRPISIAQTPEDRTKVEDGDVVVFFNFRPDRVRQLAHALVDKNFSGFQRSRVVKDLHFVSFTEYDPELNAPIVFPKEHSTNSLAEVVSKAGLRQFHIAETEKYAHVTYFLNGGREEAFKGEDRQLIPSPKVATYDLQPEMSANAVADEAIARLRQNLYDLIVINFANADMVGHTGIQEAAKQAITTLDACIGRVVHETLSQGGTVLMTADHGNAEYNTDPESGEPRTAHTANPVPVLLCGADSGPLREGGSLSDIAPTVLDIMGLQAPGEMTGRSLLHEA